MNFQRTYKILTYSVLFLFFLSSCSKESVSEYAETSLVNVKLKGTQSQLSKLNLDVLDVQFKVSEDESNPNAWISLNTINTGVHDMTRLAEDEVLSLVDFEEFPSDFIYNIRIVLGDQNMAVKNNVHHVLNMSQANNNACGNLIQKQLKANKLYEFIVEFEIDNSVQINSNGNANFRPKINTVMRQMNLR